MTNKNLKLGSIPEKLTFFIRNTKTANIVSWRWDDVEGGNKTFEVNPCYISDSDNKKTLETGKQWADSGYYDYEKRETIKTGYKTFEIDNKPFKNIQIVTLEIRDKGGRAYKVCADIGEYKNLYFDMREDILLDTIFNLGIQPGGIIPGEFIFARVGSQMKPIRVGSFLHEKMIESTEYNEKGKCELEIGGIYSNKKGELSIYLGEYWCREPKIELGETINSRSPRSDSFKPIKNIEFSKPFKVYVFHDAWTIKYTLKKDKEYPDLWFYLKDVFNPYGNKELQHSKGDPIAYTFNIVKNHSFKEQVGKVELPIKDYVESLKEYQLKEEIEEQKKKNEQWFYPDSTLKANAKLWTLSKDKNYINPRLAKYILEIN